jgi:hypothetical protein
MDYGRILNRAWHTVWDYRALWLFGAILALTAGAGASSSYPSARGQDIVRYDLGRNFRGIPEQYVPVLIGVGIALAVEFLLLAVAVAIVRYVAETAAIGMVDAYEETGEKHTVRQGFRAGWSRMAWRLFLIDLLIGVPVAFAMLLVFAVVAAPALLWLTGSPLAGATGTAVTVILFFPAVLLAIVVGTVLSVLMRFFRRACVIEELGVRASIRRGYQVARRSWGNVAVVWLITFGIGVGWAIASLLLLVVLLPAFAVMGILGVVVGGLPALLAFGVASLASVGRWVPYIAAAGVGLGIGVPVFVVLAGAPWFFVNGLMAVFGSSVWTQTYRELRARRDAVAAPSLESESSVEGISEV